MQFTSSKGSKHVPREKNQRKKGRIKTLYTRLRDAEHHSRTATMKSAVLTLVLLSLAGFALSLECSFCVGSLCDGHSLTIECSEVEGVTAACATYTNHVGLLTKNCVTQTLCDGTLDLGYTNVECCYSDMCNSSSRLGTSFAFVFCLVLLNLFL